MVQVQRVTKQAVVEEVALLRSCNHCNHHHHHPHITSAARGGGGRGGPNADDCWRGTAPNHDHDHDPNKDYNHDHDHDPNHDNQVWRSPWSLHHWRQRPQLHSFWHRRTGSTFFHLFSFFFLAPENRFNIVFTFFRIFDLIVISTISICFPGYHRHYYQSSYSANSIITDLYAMKKNFFNLFTIFFCWENLISSCFPPGAIAISDQSPDFWRI